MLNLLLGGAASGKSAYAEQLLDCCNGEKLYIATMRPFDAECGARIRRHRAARAGRGFQTLECFTGLEYAAIGRCAGILLECISNLAANELFEPQGAGEQAAGAILRGVERLCKLSEKVVVVSNEIFSDGIAYDPEIQRYIRLLGEINRALAARADRVTEVVYSIPVERR